MKIDKLDLYQRGLHYKKEARLEGIPEINDGMFVLQHVMQDVTNKLNEVIDTVNAFLPAEPIQKSNILEQLKVESNALKTTIDVVLDKFVNKGEDVIVNSSPEFIEDGVQCDVMVVPTVPADPQERGQAVWKALGAAEKRAVFILPDSDDSWSKLMARVPYHYTSYDTGGGFDIHIIDKEEKDAPVVSPPKNSRRKISDTDK